MDDMKARGPRGQRRPRRRPDRPARRRLRVGLTRRGPDDDRPDQRTHHLLRGDPRGHRPGHGGRRARLHARRGHRRLRRRLRCQRRPRTTASGASGSGTPRSPSSASSAPRSAPPWPGMRPIVEIQFSDFTNQAMDQIVNQAAKIHFMLGGAATVPMVLRAPVGSGTGAAAQHSQSLEAWFAHVPGLKVVMPATADGRQGPAALGDRRPEPGHRARAQAALPHLAARCPRSRCGSRSARPPYAARGADLTIVATGVMVSRALEAAETLHGAGIDVSVIDPRTLSPARRRPDPRGRLPHRSRPARAGGARPRRVHRRDRRPDHRVADASTGCSRRSGGSAA